MLMEKVPRILIYLCFILASTTCINGSCTFPSQFQNSSWWDSTKGLLTFTVSSMSGWKFDAYSISVSNWGCWDMTYFQTDGYFIIKSTDVISFFGVNYFAYLCLKMTKVTDYSYYYYQQYDSACTFPSIFSGVWWDSNRGVLTFGSDNISGLSVTIYVTDLQNWDCWQVDGFQGQNDGGTVIIKARDFLSALGMKFYVYLCLNLTRISAYSFYYYQMYDRQANAKNERVFVTNAHEDMLTKDDICKKQLDPGFDAEFKLLLKKGSESDARQELPVQLLGNFEYTFMDTSGSYCSSPAGQMETCGDKKTMVFDYTKCRKEIAYSTSGNLSCVATLQKASQIYVMMYNLDPAEPSYRFTCFVVSSDGTSASYVYKHCSSNQSPDRLSQASDGSYIGGQLSLKMNAACYNSNYETVWTTRGQTTMSVNVQDTTNVTVQSTHHDTTNVTVQSTHHDTTNVIVQSTHQDTTNVTVQSTHHDTTNVTQISKSTELSSGPTAPNEDTTKSSDSQEKTDMTAVRTEDKISAGAIVAIGVTVLSAVVITVVIIYCVKKRRSPSMKRKLPSFLNFSN